MKHKSIFKILSALIIFSLHLSAQNETKIWYFGANAGLDFNTNPPTILTNGALNTQEGCSSIADANGNLLFYTDGVTIWNKQHSVMANGTGLLGHQSTTQAALIVKQPGLNSNYYVFTLDAQGYINGLRYSIVDMNLAAGNGSITAKNVLLHTPSEEKLAATLHANGTDVWIMSHDFNSINFRCFLLTSAGVSTNVVISSGVITHDATFGPTQGTAKFSHNSKKFGVCVSGLQTCELYDFNANTGVLFNPIVLSTVIPGPYGCEFSNDNSKFYAGSLYDGSVYQWNLCAGTSSAIINSQYLVHSGNLDYKGTLQIASDGKIYLTKLYSNYLATINNPNSSGSACNYVELGQLISAISNSQVGLPNFVSSFFNNEAKLSMSVSPVSASVCAGESLTLTVSGANTYSWNAVASTSTIVVSLNTSTVFTVAGTFSNNCILTGTQNITISPCLSLENQDELSDFTIYPNPVSDYIHITAEFPISGKFEITNCLNELVWYAVIDYPVKQYAIPLNNLQSGLYFLRFINPNYKAVIKSFIINS